MKIIFVDKDGEEIDLPTSRALDDAANDITRAVAWGNPNEHIEKDTWDTIAQILRGLSKLVP